MDRAALTPAEYLPHLRRAAADVVAVLETGELGAPVPGCAPWTLTDLAHHLGEVHRWARAALAAESRPDRGSGGGPAGRAALVAWFRDGGDTLLTALADTEPESPCWTFGPRPRTAAFWFRRQALETAVHAGDAAASQGAVRSYGSELALDGIDEVVGLMFPRQVLAGRTPPLPHALAVEPTEGGRWVLAGDGTAPPPEVDATVEGPAEALLPLLWHRIALDDPRLSVSGDRSAAATVLAAALTP